MSDTITIVGNVATDPEHRRMPSGVPVTTFRVASGQRRFDRATGQWLEAGTNWYSVSTFRGLAEHSFHSLRKGDRVVLTGRLRVRQWESGGKSGTAVEIDVDAIGHDLLWGTSTFSKDVPAATPGVMRETASWSAAEPSNEADAWAPDAAGIGTWGTPGDAEPAPPERSTELVGAETPF